MKQPCHSVRKTNWKRINHKPVNTYHKMLQHNTTRLHWFQQSLRATADTTTYQGHAPSLPLRIPHVLIISVLARFISHCPSSQLSQNIAHSSLQTLRKSHDLHLQSLPTDSFAFNSDGRCLHTPWFRLPNFDRQRRHVQGLPCYFTLLVYLGRIWFSVFPLNLAGPA